MANRYAVASGNWSNPAIWDGGTLPTTGDDVRANGFTVTIDQDINVTSIQTTAFAPAAAGGGFSINASGRTITANIIAGTTTCLTYNGALSLSIIGNIFAGTGIGVSSNNTSSILTLTGNITGGATFGSHGVSTSGTIIMTGDCIGGVNNNNALNLGNSAASATITGNVTGGTGQGRGVDSSGVSGTSINITGNIIGGVANAIGQSAINANIVINGNIIGGNNGVGVGLGGGTLTGNFIVYGSPTGTAAGLAINGGTVVVKQIVFSNIGTSPVVGKVLFDNSTQIVTVLKQNSTTANLVDIAGADYPISANVRQGTSYASGLYIGTLVVPPASAVTKDVVFDNGTVGTAQNTAASFLSELSTSTDPLAVRLQNVATVQTTGDQIAAASPS